MRAGDRRSSLVGSDGRRRLAVLGAIGVAALLYLSGVVDFFWQPKLGRDRIEEEVRTALLYQGVTVADVSCPEGLDRKRGASVVCTYTDFALNVDETLARPRRPRPPVKGRVEIRISGFKARGWGNNKTREPQFEAHVIEPARRPGPH